MMMMMNELNLTMMVMTLFIPIESTDDEDSDDEIQDANVEGDKMNEEETYEEDEANVLYRDANVNLEGRDTVMTDAPLPNVQAT
ncbi:hypothetical protein Tco_0416216 [Tanacetum coccineum]